MSGISTGTRLEQLRALERRARVQLEHATAHDDHDLAARLGQLLAAITREIRTIEHTRPEVAAAVRHADTTVEQRLTELGVTARDVKVWAVQQGLLDAVKRGRIASRYVEAYEHARGDA